MSCSLTRLQKIAWSFFAAVIFLLPLKFGGMLLPGVPQRYPESIISWMVTTLPPALFPIVAGCLLLSAVLAFGMNSIDWKSPAGRILLLFLLLPVAALPGIINADGWENSVIELEYICSLSAFAAASAIILNSCGAEYRQRLINIFAAGTLLTALIGVYQYFYGFDELKKFIEMQEKVYNVKISADLKARALDIRTYATFTFASAFAGFLVLAGGLSVVRMYRWGSNFEPAKLSQKIFGFLALALCGGIFLTTRGRSAFLAVIIAAALCGWLMIKQRKIKIMLLAAAALAITSGAFYIHYAGRGFGSMAERVGYLKTSVEMLTAHPFCGGGWGDFTYAHALNKSFGNQELAKDPHNIVAAFAAQAGLAGGLLTALLLLYILYQAYRKMKQSADVENVVLFSSLCAFVLHSLMDLDWQVPGLMASFIFLSFFAVGRQEEKAISGSVFIEKPSLNAAAIAMGALTVFCGIHWSMADQTFGNMLAAAGMEAGVYSQPRSSYEVDAAARNALKIAPYSHSIYNAWANDKMRRHDLYRAEDLYKKALKYAPRSHAIHKSLSEIYLLQGDSLRAKEYADKADKLFPYRKIFFNKQKGLKNE